MATPIIRKIRALGAAAVVLGVLLGGWALAQSSALSGPVRVIDGDTIVLTNSNTHIRLNGIDAPEVVHPGYDHADTLGPEARDALRRIVGLAIVLIGEKSADAKLRSVAHQRRGGEPGSPLRAGGATSPATTAKAPAVRSYPACSRMLT
jgi:endonuclease YncB( thermonuclease family)